MNLVNKAVIISFTLYVITIGTTSQISSFYGMGTGTIALGSVACTGTERSLINCPSGSLYRCTHSHDAGVRCMLQTGNKETSIVFHPRNLLHKCYLSLRN